MVSGEPTNMMFLGPVEKSMVSGEPMNITIWGCECGIGSEWVENDNDDMVVTDEVLPNSPYATHSLWQQGRYSPPPRRAASTLILLCTGAVNTLWTIRPKVEYIRGN
jgi:hypothetical protein